MDQREELELLGDEYVALYDKAKPYLSGEKLHPDIKFDFHQCIRYAREGRVSESEWWKGWLISGIDELEGRNSE